MNNRHISENILSDADKNRQLLEDANIAVVVVQDFKILYVNMKTEGLFGYSKAELISQNFAKIIHPEDRSLVASRHHLRTNGENVPDSYEFRIVTKQNVHAWVEIRASLIQWENKNAVLCFIADINDRKLAMDAIKQNENVLNSIFNASPTGILLLENRIIRKVNRTLCELTGYLETELINRSTALLYPDHDAFLQAGKELYSATNPHTGTLETALKRKDGSFFYAKITYSPFISGNLTAGVCATVTDITREKQLFDDLNNTVAKLNAILEFQPDPTFVIDENKKVIAWNKAIENLTGIKKQEIIGQGEYAYAMPFYNQKRPMLIDLAIEALTDTRSQYSNFKVDGDKLLAEVFSTHLNNGNGMHLWGVASPIYDQNDHRIGAIETIRDVTDRKMAEKELLLKNAILSIQQEASIDGILVVNREGIKISHNRRFVDMWNIPKEIADSHTDTPTLQFVKNQLQEPDRFLEKVKYLYSHENEIATDELLLADGRIFERYSAPMRSPEGTYYGRIWTFHDITERKVMENEVRHKESVLRKIYEILPVGLWIADKDGTIVSTNPAGEKIWGAEPHATQNEYEVLKGRRLPSGKEIAHDDWALAHTINKGITVTDELLEIDAFDGTKKIILNYTAPVLDDKGNILGAIIVNQDITEMKKTLDLLRHSEDRFRAFVEQSADGLSLTDENGNCSDWNSSMERITGYPRQEMIGRSWLEQTLKMMLPENKTPERIASIKQAVQDLLASSGPNGSRAPFNVKVLTKDGQVIVVQQSIFTITTQAGRMIGSINRDITAISKTERALKESEERFRQIADNVNEGFWVVDLKSQKCIFSNPAMDNLFGKCLTGMHTIEIYNSIHIDDQKIVKRSRLSGGHRESEFRIVRQDGNMRWIRCHSFPVVGKDGVPLRLLGLTSDITEQKKAAIEAEQQRLHMMQIDKMATLGTLVSGVAHEINNPNNYLMLNSTIIERAWKDIFPIIEKHFESNPQFKIADLNYTKARKLLPDIIQGLSDGTQRIKRIVDSLRDYARNEADCMSQDVDVNKVVESSLVLLANMLRTTTDNFSSHLDPQLPRIKGNSHQLEQVAINLISNACQALEHRSQRIEVLTLADGEDVVLNVVDEGRGISEENLKHIFDPFFTTKRDIGGTGLGLPISKKIIHNMGGSIIVESKEAQGTTVSVRFNTVR